MRVREFCVAMLFAVILLTVASAEWSGQQRSSAYDPWLDYNEDGVIDVNELQQIAQAYGSSGEPIRNVTISRHATSYIRLGGASNISIPAMSSWLSEIVSIDGYAKVTVLIRVSNSGSYSVIFDLFACDNDGHSWLIETVMQGTNNWVKTYDVMSQGIRVKISNNFNYMITADVGVYLVA